MNKVQETYLALLRVAIWGSELTDEWVKELTNERVNEVIRLAAFQGTGPLVYDQLLKQKAAEIPSALRMQMKQQCVMSMMQQNAMMPILMQACKALEDADVHPVLLKGFGLAQYYPQPYLRQWGDIDLFVGRHDYHIGCEVLRKAFPNVEHTEEELENHKHYNFDFGNTVLEMHRISMAFAHPRDRRYYEKLEEMYLSKDGPKIEVGDSVVTLPEDTFNVLYVFLHTWGHFFETGINMKQLCDIAVLLHAKRDVLNRGRLKEMLNKLHLMEVWQLMMYIMVQYMGMLNVECPFYIDGCRARAEMLFERVLTEGKARRIEKMTAVGSSYLKRKWLTFHSRMKDSELAQPYAPKYAHHMVRSTILHGIERILKI